jgi:hypothetical protein
LNVQRTSLSTLLIVGDGTFLTTIMLLFGFDEVPLAPRYAL